MECAAFREEARDRAWHANGHSHYFGDPTGWAGVRWLAGKIIGQDVAGPPSSGDAANRYARDVADFGGTFYFAGNFRAAVAARHIFGPGRRGFNRGAQGFHRGISRLVRADGQEWHSSGRLGGN